MHQPDNQPRHSIYYRYQVHPAAPRPQPAAPTQVLVVGAGPVGLTLALALARQGIRVVLAEAQQQVSEGSRAIVFTRRSMEILQQVGVDRAITRQGLPWRYGNSFYRGQTVFRMAAPRSEDDRFFPMINLQQQYLEEALVDQVAAQPLIELRWGHAVTAIVRNEDKGAEIEIDTPEGPYVQKADWVVAADGARSVLRRLMGLELVGEAYEGRFVIADIRIDLPFPTERRAYFDPAWNPGNTVLMHREPHGIWRIDYQLPPGETPEEALLPSSLMARIDAQLEMVGAGGTRWQLDWCSVYSARALTLERYVHQRICFAGDAAHLLPIFGVRGANTGLQDAQNLAWKLAATLKRLAGPGLMDSYSQERVGAAREIIEEAGKSTRFMTPPSAGFRLLRDATLSLSLSQDFVRPLFHWRTSRAHDYAASALNAGHDDDALFAAGPAVGAVMHNVKLGPDHYLMDDSRPGFVLLSFGPAALTPEVAQTLGYWRSRGAAIWHWQVLGQGHTAEGGVDHPAALPAEAAPGRAAAADLNLAAVRVGATAVSGGAAAAAVAAAVPGLPASLDELAAAVPAQPNHALPDRVLADPEGRIWAQYGVDRAGAVYLIRPDQHVAARWMSLDVVRLDGGLNQVLARQS